MALTISERQHRYRQRLAERKLAVHKLPGLPASHRDRLARLVAVERTQLRATISTLRRKGGESALAELRAAERALRWWGALAAAQGLEATVSEGAEEGKTRSPRGSHAG